jgi:hypothetical protein
METVLAAAARNAEAGPLAVAGYAETIDAETVAGLIRRARTPLFLPSDENMEPSDELYVDEAKDSSSGGEESNVEGSKDVEEANKMDVDQTLRD